MIAAGRQIWIDALRSGDYKQGRGRLGGSEKGYCCLGLAAKLAVDAGVIKNYNPYAGSLQNYWPVKKWIGVKRSDAVVELSGYTYSLVMLNDAGFSFSQLADIIEFGAADA